MRSSKRRVSARRSHGAWEEPRCVSRRSLLRGALLGGTAVAPMGAGLDAPLAGDRLRAAPLPQGASRTLTLVTNRAPSDLDPHSAYDAGSGVLLQGPFEGLIRAQGQRDGRVRAGAGGIVGSQRRQERVDVPASRRRDVSGRDAARCLRGPGVVRTPVGVGSCAVNRAWAIPHGPSSSHRSRPAHPRLRPGTTAAAVRDGAGLRLRHRDRQHGRVEGPRGRWRLGARVGADQQCGAGHRPVPHRRVRRRDGGRSGAVRRVLAWVGGRAIRPGHPARRRRTGDAARLDRERRRGHRHDAAARHGGRTGAEPGPGWSTIATAWPCATSP